MVKLCELLSSDINDIFDSLREAQSFIRRKNYKLRRFTKSQLISTLKNDIKIDRIEKNKLLEERKLEERVYSGTLIPNIKKENIRTRNSILKKIFSIINNPECDYNPRFLQIHQGNLFKEDNNIIMNSETQGRIFDRLKEAKLNSELIGSPGEMIVVKQQIRSTIADTLGLNFKNDRNRIDEVYNAIRFKEYEISPSNIDGIDLTYKINGRIKDFTQYIIAKCSEEPNITEIQDLNENPINCIIKCIISQIPKYLGVKRKKKLLTYNKKDMTINDIKEIASNLKIDITILDCEGDLWDSSYYAINKNHTQVYILLHNNHARDIKKEYRNSLSHDNNEPNLDIDYVDPYIKPVLNDDDKKIYLETTGYAQDKTVMVKIINGDSLQTIPYQNIIFEGIIICYLSDDKLEPILKMLIKNNVNPSILSNSRSILSLSIAMNKTIIHFRSKNSKHELTNLTPWYNNYTLGSSVMYLFRKFLCNSIMKISDPLISNIFKSVCSPLCYMNKCEVSDNVYLIDIKKAYRNNCFNLGSFNQQPEIRMNLDFNTILHFDDIKPTIKNNLISPLKEGIYELYPSKEWVIRDDLYYRISKGEHTSYRYYILYDTTTNVLDDFAKNIESEDSVFSELSDKTRKNSFNILIGKLNPNLDNISTYSIFNERGDLDRFLLKKNKKILRLDKIGDKYLVEYFIASDKFHMVSHNANYLSAQIIARCRLKIKQQTDKLISQGYNIVGTMTDSILFHGKKKYELDNNDFKIEAIGDKLISGGIGQYKIYDNNELIYERHQAYESTIKDQILKAFSLKTKVKKKKLFQLTVDNLKDNFNTLNATWINGPAGVGKSHYIVKNYRRYIKVAYTGMAASEINGKTINSMFKLGSKGQNSIEYAIGKLDKQTKLKLIAAKGLVVDEAYTLNYNIAFKMSEILKFIRCNSLPFGGIPLVLCGDDRQTKSIGSSFIGSNLYNMLNINRIDLDPHDKMRLTYQYYDFMNQLREDMTLPNIKKLLKSDQYSQNEIEDNVIALYYTNDEVNKHNKIKLENFEGDKYILPSIDEGNEYSNLNFKEGCPIIVKQCKTINNGTFGIFVKSDKKEITINIANENITIPIENIKIKLGFAMTIHSAQCKTLPNINVFLKTYELKNKDIERLLYTALTRVRDFKNCHINLS